ncbi:MAG: DUF2871 domain-containing protein [Jatrophihabitans sp.]|nr:MAG: DUF2871 domain-containing protein [Jatrophihabitans sp.]
MRALFCAAFSYLIVGLASGLFLREFTKAHDFPDSRFTQLGVVHTHLLVLGFLALLLVLVLEKVFTLSAGRTFGWFFWTYNAGVVVTAAMMTWHGSLTVVGREGSSMISGIAGLGHILLTVGLILLMVALGRAIVRPSVPATAEPAVASVP